MSTQAALDALRTIAYNTDDRVVYEQSMAAYQALLASSAIQVYCSVHRGNHPMDLHDVERLIQAMAGQISDLETAPEDAQHVGESGWQVVAEWCPVNALNWMLDGETYQEHVDSMVEARRRSDVVVEATP